MNNTSMIKALLAVAAFSFAVSGCKNDDDNKPGNNYSVDGTTTKITSALFRYPSSKVVLLYGSVYKK